MKIKLTNVCFLNKSRLLMVIMRTFIFLFCTAIFAFSPNNVVSQNSKIKIKEDKVLTVDEVFDLIMKQTDYKFFYEEGIFKNSPKVHVKKGTIRTNKLLSQSLSQDNLAITITDNNSILIKEKPKNKIVSEQQSHAISGTIVDESGQPLIGANILEKGTTNGTQTDFDGKFSLNIANGNATLVVSYLGFVTKEIVVANQTTISITLQEDTAKLEEVVIVGYGKSSQKKLVSAVSQVKTDKMAKAPYTNIVEGLAGRASGLIVTSSGGDYGSIPRVSIRGGGDPAVYIDDIQRDMTAFAALPPGDIQNISILKDAASTAIYGFNAPNGVILVTTKSGSKEKISFTYSSNFSFQRPTTNPERLNSYNYSLLRNRASFNDGVDLPVSDEQLEVFRTNSDPVNHPSRSNAYDLAINKMALLKRHNIALSGTSGNTTLFTSLDFFRQDGLFNGNDFGQNRYSLNSNITHRVEDLNLTIKSNLNILRSERESTPIGNNLFSHIRNWKPGDALFNEAGNYITNENPLAEADAAAGVNRSGSTNLNYRLELALDIPAVPGLTLKAVGKYGVGNGFNKNFRINPSGIAPLYSLDNTLRDLGRAELSQSADENSNYTLEGHIKYIKSFNKHNLDFTGVYTVSEGKGEGFNASRRNFPSSSVPFLFAGSADGINNNGSGSENGRVGYVGRLKYDFDSKYIVQVSGRYDGFDGFEEGFKFNFFPSVALGWNVDNEVFAKPLLDKLGISAFKLRGSWGTVGNSGGRFSYLSRFNLNQNVYYSNGAFQTGFSEGGLTPSQNTTTWSEIESRNLALDFGFFNNKLTGKIDWFYYSTTGFLGSPEDTYTTPLGKNLPVINIDSEHRREGIEIDLQYRTKLGNVDFYLGGNVTYYDQLWAKTDESEEVLKNPYTRQAHRIDILTTGYNDLGYYQTNLDLLNSPHREASTSTYLGDIRYKDENGDGRIDGDDFRNLGKGNFPHIQYGISTGISYKALSVNVLFQGTSNRQLYLGDIWYNGGINHKLYTVQNDSWSPTNTNAEFPRISSFSTVNGNNNQTGSSFWLKDAWYVRMKSLDVTYNIKSILPNNVLQGISRWDITLSATNLFTISPLNKYGLDPETSSANDYGYPVGKNFNIGMSLTF